MTSPRAISAPRSLMTYSLAGRRMSSRMRIAGTRMPSSCARLLAQHRDALEQVAALLLVDERDERVADFELDRIDLEQVGHRIGDRRSRRRRLRLRAPPSRDALLLRARRRRDRARQGRRRATRNGIFGRPGHEAERRRAPRRRCTSRAGARSSWSASVRAHARAAGGVRDHDAGGGADDQRRDLRDETVADREDRVLRQRLADRQAALERADEDAADDVDGRDEQAGDRVALHELGGTVHRAVEVRRRARSRRGAGAPAFRR